MKDVISRRLKDAREKNGLTQAQAIGIASYTINFGF
jgi:DNA-binding XRE family transcriptional regulator